MTHVIAVAVLLPSFFGRLRYYIHLCTFLRFFENPKKRDFLRFFGIASHVFSNYAENVASTL